MSEEHRSQATPLPNARDARERAARSLFGDLTIEVIDEHHWRVAPPAGAAGAGVYLFWPATGHWRHPDGRSGHGGALGLARDIRAAAPADLKINTPLG